MVEKRQSLRDYGIRHDTSEFQSRIGSVLAIREVTRNDSLNYGRGFEVRYDVIADLETGELEESDCRSITFAQPVVRDLIRIVGDQSAPYPFTPPLVVKLVADGRTFLMEDVE